MLSFFARQPSKAPLSLNQLIDLLQRPDLSLDEARAQITSFDRDDRSRHRNTYLLLALAWNNLLAASRLIDLDTDGVALNLPDKWPTCINTPLILAAKINAVTIIRQLIHCGASLDMQDYRGYTALHYACLYRSEIAITLLLDAGASPYLRDAFGKLPQDYYAMEILPEDLSYRYGEINGELRHISDNNNHYFATKMKMCSALRWYIPHLMINADDGKDIMIRDRTLFEWAQHALQVQSPVYDAAVYKAMMKLFCDSRPSVDTALLRRLKKVCGKLNPYIEASFNRYYLHVMDFVPPSAVSIINDEIWIELQVATSSSSPETPVRSSICHP